MSNSNVESEEVDIDNEETTEETTTSKKTNYKHK